MKEECVHSKLDEIAHVCTRFDLSVHTQCTRKPECTRVATFTQLASGNWRVQVRRKTRYVAETFRRRKDGEEWGARNGAQYRPQRIVQATRDPERSHIRQPDRPARRRHARSWKAPSPVKKLP